MIMVCCRSCGWVHMGVTTAYARDEFNRFTAYYDTLTKLPNRRLLMDRLSTAIAAQPRNGAVSAVLFINLDHFKTLNDTLGFDSGDNLLTQVSSRLVSCVPKGDTVARAGGDEFVIILEALNNNSTVGI